MLLPKSFNGLFQNCDDWKFWIVDPKRVLEDRRVSSSLTFSPLFILYFCIFVSFFSPPTPTPPGVFLSSLSLSMCCALKSQLWRVKDVLFSRAVHHTHMHQIRERRQCKHTCRTMTVWLSVLAGGPSVNEISWIYHISVCGYANYQITLFLVYGYDGVCPCGNALAVFVTVCVACRAETLWQWCSFSLQWSFWHVCFEQTHMSQLHILPNDKVRRKRKLDGGMEMVMQPCPPVSLFIFVI